MFLEDIQEQRRADHLYFSFFLSDFGLREEPLMIWGGARAKAGKKKLNGYSLRKLSHSAWSALEYWAWVAAQRGDHISAHVKASNRLILKRSDLDVCTLSVQHKLEP